MARQYTKMKHMESLVFEMKAAGKTNAEIGQELGLTKDQVKGIVKRYNRRQNQPQESEEPTSAPCGAPAIEYTRETYIATPKEPPEAAQTATAQTATVHTATVHTATVHTATVHTVAIQPVIQPTEAVQPVIQPVAAQSPEDIDTELSRLAEEVDSLEGTLRDIKRLWGRLEQTRKAVRE